MKLPIKKAGDGSGPRRLGWTAEMASETRAHLPPPPARAGAPASAAARRRLAPCAVCGAGRFGAGEAAARAGGGSLPVRVAGPAAFTRADSEGR